MENEYAKLAFLKALINLLDNETKIRHNIQKRRLFRAHVLASSWLVQLLKQEIWNVKFFPSVVL